MHQPTLVIGLGGTGKNILLALKKTIAENSKNGLRDYPFLRLLSIDTDVKVPENRSSIQTLASDELDLNSSDEVFSLRADFNIVPDLSPYPEINEWFPESLRHNLTPAELERGAGQRKPIGRFTFAWNAQELYERLRRPLANPVDMTTVKDRGIAKFSGFTNVFICGSICGGTSAGTFLDVAHMVRHIASTNTNRKIFIYGLFATASLFDDIQGDSQIRPNCYSSLVELDHFMNEFNYRNDYRRFRPAYKNYTHDYQKSAAQGPFDFPFLFDRTNQRGISFTTPAAFSEMAARFIYLLTGHEVANDYQSMDNNVRTNLGNLYRKELMQKPIEYRSMGVFSVLFPKRMVSQLCAYRLMVEYLNVILDDGDAPQEYQNMAKAFLAASKLDPVGNAVENRFDGFRDSEFSTTFSAYIDAQKQEFLDRDVEKKELLKELRAWKEDMDRKLTEYRQQNTSTARQVREEFLKKLAAQTAGWLDLPLTFDQANKNVHGEARLIRGSLRRVDHILEFLKQTFEVAAEQARKKEDTATSLNLGTKASVERALEDLEGALHSLIPNSGKIKSLVEVAIDAMVEDLNGHRLGLIASWERQLYNGILENNIPKYDGLVRELDLLGQGTRKGLVDFHGILTKAQEFLANNRRYEPNPLSDVIFDFNTDVEGTFTQLMTGEDNIKYVWETLSVSIKNVLGARYEKLPAKPAPLIHMEVLRQCEPLFFDLVNSISIENKLLASPSHRNLLEIGTYMNNAAVFLGLDGAELSRVGLSTANSTFFAITIPDSYEGKPCSSLKGVISAKAGAKAVCPIQADPDKFRDDPCPKFGNCVKQMILNIPNLPLDLAVIPTSEQSEINIVNTVAGYPLHAVSTLIHSCRPPYVQAMEKQQRDNKSSGVDEESIHMFGPVAFTDLVSRTEDPRTGETSFRKRLLVALCANRLKIQPLMVSFVTKRDLDMGRKDQPSLILGKNLAEVLRRYQSTRLADQKAISTFRTEIDYLLEVVSTKPEVRDGFIQRVQQTYQDISRELPPGLTVTDLELLDEFSRETLGLTLIPAKSDSDVVFG